MSQWVRRSLGTGLATLAVFVVLASPAAASRTSPMPDPALQITSAPLSPTFLSSLVSGTPSTTPDGRPLGERPGPQDPLDARGTLVPEARVRGLLPATYDLRTLGRVTSMKDQGPHGTCWAFASCGSLESCLLPGETRDFSEDNMVLTSGFDSGGDPYGKGGNIYMSSAYLVRWGGPVDEADDAYGDGYTPPGLTPRKHVQEVVWIPYRGSALDNENVKDAVMQYGAVYVAMGWFGSSVDSSYYNPATSSYYYDDGFLTNHGVLIVGWDDGYAAANFATTPPGDGAFIVKNSWGTDWGDGGYFHVSYYDAAFGLTSPMAAFCNAEATDGYADVYQYDPLGYCEPCGSGQLNRVVRQRLHRRGARLAQRCGFLHRGSGQQL